MPRAAVSPSSAVHAMASGRGGGGGVPAAPPGIDSVTCTEAVGHLLWCGHSDGSTTIRDPRHATVVDVLRFRRLHGSPADAAAPACMLHVPDMQTVWVGYSDGRVLTVSEHDHEVLGGTNAHVGPVRHMIKHGDWVFSCSDDTFIYRYSAYDEQPVRQLALEGHTAPVRGLCSSGSVLLSVSLDQTARIWGCADGAVVTVLSFTASASDGQAEVLARLHALCETVSGMDVTELTRHYQHLLPDVLKVTSPSRRRSVSAGGGGGARGDDGTPPREQRRLAMAAQRRRLQASSPGRRTRSPAAAASPAGSSGGSAKKAPFAVSRSGSAPAAVTPTRERMAHFEEERRERFRVDAKLQQLQRQTKEEGRLRRRQKEAAAAAAEAARAASPSKSDPIHLTQHHRLAAARKRQESVPASFASTSPARAAAARHSPPPPQPQPPPQPVQVRQQSRSASPARTRAPVPAYPRLTDEERAAVFNRVKRSVRGPKDAWLLCFRTEVRLARRHFRQWVHYCQYVNHDTARSRDPRVKAAMLMRGVSLAGTLLRYLTAWQRLARAPSPQPPPQHQRLPAQATALPPRAAAAATELLSVEIPDVETAALTAVVDSGCLLDHTAPRTRLLPGAEAVFAACRDSDVNLVLWLPNADADVVDTLREGDPHQAVCHCVLRPEGTSIDIRNRTWSSMLFVQPESRPQPATENTVCLPDATQAAASAALPLLCEVIAFVTSAGMPVGPALQKYLQRVPNPVHYL